MIDPTNDPEGDMMEKIIEYSVKRVEDRLHDVVLEAVYEACAEVVEDECGAVGSMWEDRMLDYKASMTDLVRDVIMKRFV